VWKSSTRVLSLPEPSEHRQGSELQAADSFLRPVHDLSDFPRAQVGDNPQKQNLTVFQAELTYAFPELPALETTDRQFFRVFFCDGIQWGGRFFHPPFSPIAGRQMIGNPHKPAPRPAGLSALLKRRKRNREDLSRQFLCCVSVAQPPQQIAKYPRVLNVVKRCKGFGVHPGLNLRLSHPRWLVRLFLSQ
jgi:hypothetical protein